MNPDPDGDGVDELLMSSHGDHGGSAWLLYGPIPTGETSVEQVAARLWNVDGEGLAELDLAADLTGDGRADLLVGSWYPWGDQPQGWVVPGGVVFAGDDLDRDGTVADDCDDADGSINPGVAENTSTKKDEDCDPSTKPYVTVDLPPPPPVASKARVTYTGADLASVEIRGSAGTRPARW